MSAYTLCEPAISTPTTEPARQYCTCSGLTATTSQPAAMQWLLVSSTSPSVDTGPSSSSSGFILAFACKCGATSKA
eukprot:11187-Heterococcus_DN1.PRE.1